MEDIYHDWLASEDSKEINPATAIPGFDIDKDFNFIGRKARNRKYEIYDKAFALKVGVEVMDKD